MKRPDFSRWFILGILGILLFGWVTTGTIIYVRLFILIVLLILTAYCMNWLALRGIQIKRRTRSLRTSVGKIFDEQFDIFNNSRLPCFWLEILDNSPIPQKSGSRLITVIEGKRHRIYSARTRITKRGAYPLGPIITSSGDPFGFITTHRVIQPIDTLVVLPLTVDIRNIQVPGGLLPGGREIHQKTLDVTPHATGVREYLPGDPMKRIHWPSSAKRNHFMVKIYELDPEAEIWFFLDSQQKGQFSKIHLENEIQEDDFVNTSRSKIKLPDDTYEYSISATASLAKYFLLQRKIVGLVSSGKRTTVIPAERGERQIGKILETLSYLVADGDLPVVSSVNLQAKNIPMGSCVLIVSPSLERSLLSAVDGLILRKIYPMVVLILAEAIGGPVGSEKTITELKTRSVPVIPIIVGQDLGKQLNQL